MKKPFAALLALACALSPGLAAAGTEKGVSLPESSAVRTTPAALTLPGLGAVAVAGQLSKPPLADVAIGPQTTSVAAAVKQIERAALAQTAQTPQGQGPSIEAQAAKAEQTYDGAKKRVSARDVVLAGGVLAGATALAAFVPGFPAAPLAVETARLSAAKTEPTEKRPIGERVLELAESGLAAIPFAIASAFEIGVLHTTMWLAPVMALTWGLAASGGISILAGQRSKVIGGWQASHDQKYRHGYDGRLRDIRGKKYGEDRYDERVDGEVSSAEQSGMRAVAAMMGWLMMTAAGASPREMLAYNLTLAGAYGLLWLKAYTTPAAQAPVVRPHER